MWVIDAITPAAGVDRQTDLKPSRRFGFADFGWSKPIDPVTLPAKFTDGTIRDRRWTMRTIALVEGYNHVCCRYRIRAFEPAIRASGGSLIIEPLAENVWKRMAQFHAAADFDRVILQRKLLDRVQFGILRGRARRLIFDFDDAVLYRDSYHPRGLHCKRRVDRFQRTVSQADAILAGNEFLARTALDHGADPSRIHLMPTCVAISTYQPKIVEPRTDRPIELVWVGSSSTLQGIERSAGIWNRLGREIPRLRLRVIADRFPRFDSLEVLEIRWTEATEQVEIRAGDIGVSVIPDDLWSRGKCGLKLLQYMASGLPVVANPVGVHRELIEHGETGFLASTPEEWLDAIRLLSNDPGLRRRIGERAREFVARRYSVESRAVDFVAAITGKTLNERAAPAREANDHHSPKSAAKARIGERFRPASGRGGTAQTIQ